MRSRWTGVAVGLALATVLAASARAAEDPREVEGRALYAKGSYQEALDIFATLFAEKADPIYLRNIGRCNQKLRRPDQAIDAFQEYLRRARVKPAERQEVEGFIREMQEAKAQAKTSASAETAVPPPTGETRPRPPPPPEPVTLKPAPDPIPVVSQAPAPAPDGDSEAARPLTRRWWFWAAVGAIVVGAAVTAVALGAQGGSNPPPCPSDFNCPR